LRSIITITSSQSNLTTARIAAAHGRFNDIPPAGASVHPHPNTCFLGPIRRHPNPNPKRHLDRFYHFRTAHGIESLYFTTGRPSPSHGWIWTSWFLGPTRVLNPNGIAIGSAVFAQLTAEHLYTLKWAALPPENYPFPWGTGPHLIHGSLGPPKSSTQTGSRSVQLATHGLLL